MTKNSYIIDNTAEWRIKQILLDNTISESQFMSLAHYASDGGEKEEVANKRPASYYLKGAVDYLAYAAVSSMRFIQLWTRKRFMANDEQPRKRFNTMA